MRLASQKCTSAGVASLACVEGKMDVVVVVVVDRLEQIFQAEVFEVIQQV